MPAPRAARTLHAILLAGNLAATPLLFAQAETATQLPSPRNTPAPSTPIAIVPLDNGAGGATVAGALQVTAGKAIIAGSGSVTSGSRTTDVALPFRGTLRVCASTTVKLAADSSVSAGEIPGLLMAMDAGAVEMSFATAQTADVLITPDFRILIGGPGASEVKVRLGSGGDTCIDNPGVDAPYVVVTSPFDSGLYRVQPGQRVMFQHGNLHEVVDQEKEPCGCPPEAAKGGANDFPLAQSEGLAPATAPAPAPTQPSGGAEQSVPPLVYSSPAAVPQTAQIPQPTPPPPPAATPAAQPAAPAANTNKKPGIFTRFGHLLKRIFGAD